MQLARQGTRTLHFSLGASKLKRLGIQEYLLALTILVRKQWNTALGQETVAEIWKPNCMNSKIYEFLCFQFCLSPKEGKQTAWQAGRFRFQTWPDLVPSRCGGSKHGQAIRRSCGHQDSRPAPTHHPGRTRACPDRVQTDAQSICLDWALSSPHLPLKKGLAQPINQQISAHREIVRNAESQALRHTYWIIICILTSLERVICTLKNWFREVISWTNWFKFEGRKESAKVAKGLKTQSYKRKSRFPGLSETDVKLGCGILLIPFTKDCWGKKVWSKLLCNSKGENQNSWVDIIGKQISALYKEDIL